MNRSRSSLSRVALWTNRADLGRAKRRGAQHTVPQPRTLRIGRLRGRAVHPDYNRAGDADNGRFFVFYREGSGNDPHNNGQNHDPAWRPAHLALRTS